MKKNKRDILAQNRIFIWIVAGAALLTTIPWFLMKNKILINDPGSGYENINWNWFDFMAFGGLLFGVSSLFVFIARKINKRNRIILAVILLLIFVWLWAELAVGIFTTLGN